MAPGQNVISNAVAPYTKASETPAADIFDNFQEYLEGLHFHQEGVLEGGKDSD